MPDTFTSGIPSGRDGDRWTWDYQAGPATTPVTYPFSLSAVDSIRPATLTLWLIGYTAGDHRWTVQVNGVGIGEAAWSGRTAVTVTLTIRTGVLRDGANALSLRPVLTEGAWLDAFAVRHARGLGPAGSAVTFAGSPSTAYTVTLAASGPYRAYDVTDPLRPVRLTGLWVDGQRITLGDPSGGGPRRYHVAAEGAIRAPDRVRPPEDLWGFRAAGGATGANYLIITHPAFADALGPLIDLRRSQGLTVAVVNVLGIYDAYGDGRPDPEAIRRFIADAYANWNPRPVYVLLVGDGSFDPKQYRSESPPTYIPPYLLDVGPAGGETAADNRYACVDGDDNLPDLLLGRLPVRSADEARAIVQKIVDYETRPLPGGWNASVLLVADDPDAAGDFPAISDSAAAYVTAPFTTTRRYCAGSNSSQSDCPDTEGAAIHSAILNDWNRGTLLVQYTGHSSWQQWAVERFFHLDDLPALHNSRRLPVLVEATCFTGAFHRPEPTLDEELVTRPDAGAGGGLGSDGPGGQPGASAPGRGLLPRRLLRYRWDGGRGDPGGEIEPAGGAGGERPAGYVRPAGGPGAPLEPYADSLDRSCLSAPGAAVVRTSFRRTLKASGLFCKAPPGLKNSLQASARGLCWISPRVYPRTCFSVASPLHRGYNNSRLRRISHPRGGGCTA
jgi:hypothetical protein